MEVKGKIELADLKKMSARVMLRISILLPLIVILIIALLLNMVPSFIEGSGVLSVVFNISRSWHIYLFVLLLVSYFVLSKYDPIKAYKKNLVFKNEITYAINNKQLGITTSKGRICYNWNSIYKIREYTDSFLLFHSFNEAHILPKRFFNSGSDIGRFRKILRGASIKRLKLLQ
ncbi:MAG: YcxB family protein [Spirochaetales bacterium]|nr:YcxB family protein [Spirochaetales bacterium]